MEAELENAFLPEHTLKIAKKHREYGINTQWKMYSKVEHGFFSQLSRRRTIRTRLKHRVLGTFRLVELTGRQPTFALRTKNYPKTLMFQVI